MDYSPHREAGGTLHLPSPSHAHRIDAFGASDLRRSLSRSPSKPQRYHLYAQTPTKSPAQSWTPQAVPRTFSPRLSPHHSNMFSLPQTSSVETPVPSKKKFTIRRPLKNARTPISTRSPMRRALGESSHHGNITPGLSRQRSGEENRSGSDSSDNSANRSDCKPPTFRFDHMEAPARSENARPRQESLLLATEEAPARSSPLKRGDGHMNLGQANLGTPVKRRSLHGSSLFTDTDIFNQASSPLNFDSLPSNSQEQERQVTDRPLRHQYSAIDVPFTSFSSPVVKRSSSLRKPLRNTNLVSRGRFSDSSNEALAQSQSSPLNKSRNRFSLDVSLLSQSPFGSRPSMSQSSNIYTQPQGMQSTNSIHEQPHQPHPLSRSLVPSNSGSSLTEDTDMRPPHFLPRNRPNPMDRPPQTLKNPAFSKSLPVGTLRPISKNDTSSTTDSYATPTSFKTLQNPGGFMSTGLISKRNRNPDFHPYNDTERYAMPDTPSKRASFPPVTATPYGKTAQSPVCTPFGDPTTPLITHQNRNPFDLFAKFTNSRLFGGGDSARRSSFVSEDGDDKSKETQDSQSSADELPPTPTKANGSGRIKQNSLRSSLFGRRTSLGPDTFAPIAPADADDTAPHKIVRKGKPGKVSFSQSVSTPTKNKSDVTKLPNLAVEKLSLGGSNNMSTAPLARSTPITRSQSRNHVLSPSPVLPATPGFNQAMNSCYFSGPVTKSRRQTVTPVQDMSGRSSPITPQSFTPPDSNKLSIPFFRSSTNTIPATPTAQRDHPFATYPIVTQNDVDTSITSRFTTVSTLAQGEFSVVYRVESPLSLSFLSGRSAPSPGKAWVVKKSKRQYIGPRDRQRKLVEVNVLQTLKGSDHVLEYLDHWEHDKHLYIHTEYCENGSLAKFLAETGNKARLDDFRIWKILLEITMGVKAIHDSGFIHLDLKPANIFITFEGMLKIGDFGLATQWPASKDVDVEGDREYISPEILSGRYDKPADVFAVGLITLEIAGNFFLPDNGDQWQRLRSGNLSDIPSLTWSTDSQLSRDENGDPIDTEVPRLSPNTHLSQRTQYRDTAQPPGFMLDCKNRNSLDAVVSWMLCPDPDARPTINDVRCTEGLQWVAQRRRAGATVFEGNWGPADYVLTPRTQFPIFSDLDIEMADV